MPVKEMKSLKIAAAVAAGLIALTGCTNASQSTGTDNSGTEAKFDPTSVAKDEALAAEVPEAIKSKGTLVFGTDTTYAPAEFLGGADGQTPMGYDIDIAKAIGTTLGLETEVKIADFSGILPALSPKFDLGISSFFITDERVKAADFVSYFHAGTQWVTQTGNPKNVDIDDLCGKTVGVQTGTFQEDPEISGRNAKCVEAGKEEIKVVSLKNQTDVTTRLMTGGVDTMAAGSITVAYAVSNSGGKLESLGDIYDASPVGIAVSKGDKELAEVVAKATNKLIEDGDYQKILDAWGNGDGAIEKAEINPAVSK